MHKFCRPINTQGKPVNITQAFIPGRHLGIDYGYAKGTPVYATQSGKVTLVNRTEIRSWRVNTPSDPFRRKNAQGNWIYRRLMSVDYGQFVKIQHLDGYQTLSCHMSKVWVVANQEVRKGEKIGEVGTTGNSSGNHLHYELRKVYWGLRTVFLNLANYFDSSFSNYL